MIAVWLWLACAAGIWAAPGAGSVETAGFLGRDLEARLSLPRPVPYRVFTLDAPPRLVVDFEGLEPGDLDPARIGLPEVAPRLRFGQMRPGWTRLILDLARPFAVETAELRRVEGGAELEVRLDRVSAEAFAAASGAPPGVWPSGAAREGAVARGAGAITIALDPGHGGIDPGASRAGVAEKDVVLAFARDLRAALIETGRFRVVMTRESDEFVTLGDRVELARAAGADAFLSLHTNAVEEPGIAGMIVFTRSEAGSSRAARDRAAVENSADRVAGLDQRSLDPTTRALSEITRTETNARSDELARDLARSLRPVAGEGTQDPLQSANFQVLRAPDMPSALLELGFLSNAADREKMTSPIWRALASVAIATALTEWAEASR